MAKRRYTREFKFSAVKLVNEQEYSLTEAAKSLGIDPANVRDWVCKLAVTDGVTPSGEGAMRAELRRLRKENARLTTGPEILASAIGLGVKPWNFSCVSSITLMFGATTMQVAVASVKCALHV